jgi:small subunit ribosomal protein S12
MTINQLLKKKRKKKIKKSQIKALAKCPQRKGICFKVLTVKPKKPNSARRKIVRAIFHTSHKVAVYIPGEGHTLQLFSTVLVRGGRLQDVPGVRYKAVRGKLDLLPVYLRRNGRSKYGLKRLYPRVIIKHQKRY